MAAPNGIILVERKAAGRKDLESVRNLGIPGGGRGSSQRRRVYFKKALYRRSCLIVEVGVGP